MAGEGSMVEVVEYLSRLVGEPLSADSPIRLRSVHRAALGSWVRRKGWDLKLSVISSPAPFTVRELLNGEAQPEPPVSIAPQMAEIAADHLAPPGGIGIDIEEVQQLPEAEDYREHPFFQETFTPAEISYCIRQRDVRASFCGIWAAKEALLKAGAVPLETVSLKSVEVGRDRVGRPIFPRCSLSISHTPRTAVAVCVLRGAELPSNGSVSAVQNALQAEAPPASAAKRGRWPWSR